ncbi:MAG TPA: PLP-dependent aminotransferase family protein [Kofleriaceae bacterium]|jgi:2-aminoadipate transaminase|nr:PLP-dependent aminotransferase family protein [Kofleriaceae bacterium]
MDARVSALQKQAAARADMVNLSGGLPADELMPKEELGRALAYVATRRDEALQYGWPEGTCQLRSWIASRLAARGAHIDPERVIITAGAQQALSIAASVLVANGTAVIETGAATYPGALDAFRGAGARVVSRRARAAAGTNAARVRYVTAGVEMPSGIAVECGDALAGDEPLIIDEAYAELRFDARVPRPLIADAPDRVWHVGTISKTIAPGLRVGWLIPPAADHDTSLEVKSAADLHTASICQAALSRLVATLDYEALVGRARRAYAERAERMIHALRRHASELTFDEPAGGFSIWVETGEQRDEEAFLEAALEAGVMVDPGSLFRPDGGGQLAFRLSYSNAPVDQIDEGIRRLANVVRGSAARPQAARARCS